MSGEEDYMDQLFKDHFEDFAKSPGDEVWKGIVKNGAMANGKKLGYPTYWKLGLLMGLGLFLSFGIVKGYQVLTSGEKEELAIATQQSYLPEERPKEAVTTGESRESQKIDQPDGQASGDKPGIIERQQGTAENVKPVNMPAPAADQAELINQQATQKPVYHLAVQVAPNVARHTENTRTALTQGVSVEEETDFTKVRSYINASNLALRADMLDLNHLSRSARGASWAELNDPLSVKARRDMARSWMIQPQDAGKLRGGHWFVSGAFAADAGLESDRKFVLGLDGLAFGAGKYLTPDSFIEVSLRGAWSNGFNMRANYARLFLPGRLRPFIQGGLAWGDRVSVRMGLGLMYTPRHIEKWRFYVAANYEGGFDFQERSLGETGVFEFGAQLRLSGTERVLSDNNWMNSVPLYELPTGWYADASVNFSFDQKTNVVDYSVYMGKYLRRRLFIRGGLRVDSDAVAIPVQVQYHFLMRKQLRFGAYTGAAIGLENARLGAELGFIAYYEVLPNWSLFVAPVILEGSSLNERLFETGIQLNLAKKK